MIAASGRCGYDKKSLKVGKPYFDNKFHSPFFLNMDHHTPYPWLMLKQNDFYSFKNHAYVEPRKFLITLAASLMSEI